MFAPSTPPLSGRSRADQPTFVSLTRLAWVAGVVFVLLALGGCSKQLLGSLDELTANQLVSTLRREGVNADKSPSGEKTWKVTVPDEQFADAVQIMERHNLPSQNFQGLGQVFKKESLVSTPTEERARLIHAMSQELERSLMQMDGVLVARVHPVILASDPLNPKRRSATASVLIKYRPGTDMNGRESMVRSLVAAGVEGLSYDDVRVVMVPGDTSAPLNPGALAGATTSPAQAASPTPRNTAAKGMPWLAQIPPYFGPLLAAVLGVMALGYVLIRWRSQSRTAQEGLRGRWADTVGALLGKRGSSSAGRTRSSRTKIDDQ